MPHVSIVIYPGHPEDKKLQMANACRQAVAEGLGCEDWRVSVSFRYVEHDDWNEKVSAPIRATEDILLHSHST